MKKAKTAVQLAAILAGVISCLFSMPLCAIVFFGIALLL